MAILNHSNSKNVRKHILKNWDSLKSKDERQERRKKDTGFKITLKKIKEISTKKNFHPEFNAL